jgi:predicted  nucleic acid-binding Zn-ribbon protein
VTIKFTDEFDIWELSRKVAGKTKEEAEQILLDNIVYDPSIYECNDCRSLYNEINSLQDEIDKLEADIQDLEDEVTELKKEKYQLEREVSSLEQELNDARVA